MNPLGAKWLRVCCRNSGRFQGREPRRPLGTVLRGAKPRGRGTGVPPFMHTTHMLIHIHTLTLTYYTHRCTSTPHCIHLETHMHTSIHTSSHALIHWIHTHAFLQLLHTFTPTHSFTHHVIRIQTPTHTHPHGHTHTPSKITHTSMDSREP